MVLFQNSSIDLCACEDYCTFLRYLSIGVTIRGGTTFTGWRTSLTSRDIFRALRQGQRATAATYTAKIGRTRIRLTSCARLRTLTSIGTPLNNHYNSELHIFVRSVHFCRYSMCITWVVFQLKRCKENSFSPQLLQLRFIKHYHNIEGFHKISKVFQLKADVTNAISLHISKPFLSD